jgi:hypothetical protein
VPLPKQQQNDKGRFTFARRRCLGRISMKSRRAKATLLFAALAALLHVLFRSGVRQLSRRRH